MISNPFSIIIIKNVEAIGKAAMQNSLDIGLDIDIHIGIGIGFDIEHHHALMSVLTRWDQTMKEKNLFLTFYKN